MRVSVPAGLAAAVESVHKRARPSIGLNGGSRGVQHTHTSIIILHVEETRLGWKGG